ncbi:Laminin subunit alpha-2 [Nibea albiflora]|uniref:Laminin subunit alpha-2 n=1 Tax=Nibea albiflora TaxID=240163 RepID=A0ACB7FBY4_NIBAL|nr:Laminin subunit alpha-2 [Nibea albiflora]
MADITANATCGSMGPEMFCKLVEHVPGQPVRNPQCRTCNQKSTKPFERHPIEYAIDGTNRWWQSPSIKNGMEYHYVFQIAYVILKAANSPRPGNWILERSIDGVTFEPWQYYAISETECLTRFNITPRRGTPSYTRDDEIHTSLINGRPSVDDPSPTLLNFTSARYIRFVFQRIRTLNADLMTLHHHEDIDTIVTRRYYYSIKDISVGGMCICYGHAKACPLNKDTKVKYLTVILNNTIKKFSCECEHNTCGESCDHCCPGYHQQAWMAGTFHTRHICEKCNCHGKSEECYFNQTVADLSLSLDTHGQRRGGGVCVGCRDNTAGINCQTCLAGFYRPAGVRRCPHACMHMFLITLNINCVYKNVCFLHLDRCAVGYMGYPSCQRCNCTVEGSVNEDPCITPCVCKESTLTGWHLVGETGGRVWTVHRQTPPYLSVRHSDVVNDLGSAYYWNAPGLYLGNKLSAYGGSVVYTVSYTTDQQEQRAFRVTLERDLIIEGGGIKIVDRRFGQQVYPPSPSTNHIVLLPENFQLSESGQSISRREFLSVLANITSVMVRASYSTETSAVYSSQGKPYSSEETAPKALCSVLSDGSRLNVERTEYLLSCQCHTNGSVSEVCNKDTGECQCRENVVGRQCDECMPQTHGIATVGGCVPCHCNSFGSKSFDCDENGQCRCQPGVTGPKCDRCSRGFFNFQEGGCTPCQCSHVGNNCDANTGQCICPPNTIGERCDRCAPNHWGHDIVTGCKDCGCSVIGSVTQQCNVNTGCCFCRDSFRGEKCNECQIGYRDFPQCTQCECNISGSDSQTCDLERQVCACADRTGKCSCKINVEGDNCDRCKADTFGLAVRNPLGCSKCYCYGLTQHCTEAQGLIRMWITAYGGQLKYAVYYEARDETGPSSYEPQVIIKGGPNRNVLITRHIQGLQIGQLTRHEIDMTEHEWKYADGRSMTREDFMDILFYVDYILIKASHGNLMRHSRISEISLTVAEEGRPTKESEKAHQIEKCDCPVGYSGLSCENCQDNTEGDRCERCAPGFYGVVRGFHDDCKPCACPLTNPENNFSPTCVAEGINDYRCTACPEGYEGKYCDRCSTGYRGNPRMPGGRCEESCDDECSGLLISDMDRLYRIITDVTLTTPLPPPYKMLYRFENMTEELKHMLSPQRAPERLLQLADSNLGSLVVEMDQLHSRATKVSADGEQVEDDADRIHKRAEDLEQFIRDTLLGAKDLQLKAAELNQTLSRRDGTPDKSLKEMKEEIQAMLAEMRKRQLGGKKSIAEEEMDLAEELYQKVKRLFGDPHQATEDLKAERKRSAVSGVKQEAQEVLGEGERLLNEANQLSDNINKEIEDLEEMGKELGPLHEQLDNKVSRLTDGLSDGRLANHVHDAEEHAKQLNESAALLDGILAEAKNLSFNATAAFKAYSNIKANVDAAEKEAKAAKQRASEALALGRVKAARDKTKDLLKAVNGTMATLNAIPNDTAAKLATTKTVAGIANATAIDVLERLGDLNLQLHGLQRNYSELEDTVNTANQMIQDPEKNIHAAGAKVKDLEDEADRLLEKLQPIKKLQDNLRRNISQIKELINQARKQANSIKVSVSSGGDCLRSYRPDIRKGRYNTITLHVKTTTPDNLLFYLGSAKYVDFLALEMRKGKVNFLWDVGSGVGRVEYPHHTIHDGSWHRIEASRNGLNGTISVYPLEGSMAGMMPTPASANSPTAYTILDVDQNAYLFVGGILGTVKKADAVRMTTFTGCMGETFLDGKAIGLWNYRDRQGDCKGCVVSPQRSDVEGTVQLDGEGYAAVGRPTRWNPNVSTVTFKFRTFSSEALLMYLATDDMKDFMSLELSEGKVKMNFDLGSGVGSAVSESRHNDGHWKSLTMSRNKKQATVTVVDIDSGAEEKVVVTSQGSATGLNLKENQRIYFGGLPTIGNYRPEITLKRYAGCLREIEISRTPYNLLSSSDYTGVTKGCNVENLYTVSFSKPGYMELGGLSLAVGTEISLSFSTLEDTGTILLAVGGASPLNLQPYLSVMLNKGSLEVLVFTGSHSPRRVIRRPEHGILNDGREHSLRIERLPGRSFAVQVDEEAKREAALPNDQPVSLKRIFLGGIPAEVEQTSNRANIPFQGCIWNLMVNAVLSDFSLPVSFENAEIGQCPNLAPPPPLPTLPEKEEPEKEKEELKPLRPPVTPAPATPPPGPPADSCASAVAPTALEKAYQFGLTRNSHMSFAFDDTKVREKLIIEFELRTKEESGLVLYMARINHADFVAIQKFVPQSRCHPSIMSPSLSACRSRTGRFVSVMILVTETYPAASRSPSMTGNWHKLLFHVDNGAGRITAEHMPEGEGFCDGQWHSITANKLRHKVELVVDGKQSQAESPDARSNTCDTNNPIYVGGYPGTSPSNTHKLFYVQAYMSYVNSLFHFSALAGVHQAALSTRTSFKGCMRNLKITKASKTLDVQFNKSPEIKGVQPLSCPAVAA